MLQRDDSFSSNSLRAAVAIRTNSAPKGEFNSAELGVRNRLFPVRETPEISRVRLGVLKRERRVKKGDKGAGYSKEKGKGTRQTSKF